MKMALRVLLLTLLTSAASAQDQALKPPGEIRGLRRLEETTLRLGGVGDNWHMTWARDDKQYAGLCDGTGFPGMPQKQYNSRLFAITGSPPDGVKFEYLPGYPDLFNESPEHFSRYYCFGVIALGDRIYQYLSTPEVPFHKPEPFFTGAKLIYSEDLGKTWRNQDGSTPVVWENWADRSKANMAFFREPGRAFSLITVLQMGRDYEQNRDGYVYLYSPNGDAEGTMNQLALCRVRKDKLLNRAAYEFFVSRADDGASAKWSREIADRGVVHTFPTGWVNRKLNPYAWHPSVVYYAPLGVYLMANWGMGTDEKGDWFTKPSYLGFWTATHPWGPWKQVHEETAWTPANDQAARAYQPQIAPKWIAADGKSFWLVWTDFQVVNKNGADTRPHYAFNTQKVEVITDPAPAR
jgi:hypothetical protein